MKKLKKITIAILIFITIINFITPIQVSADPGVVNLKDNYGFGWIDTLSQGFERLLAPGFALAAIAVVFYFLIGAVKFLTSGGDKNGVSEARDMITHAIIGFILLMVIFMVLQFLIKFFGINLHIF